MLKLIPIALLLTSTYASSSSSSRRVQLGESFSSYGTLTYYYESNDSPKVHAIQRDEWIFGNLLVAIGNAIYTVYPDEKSSLVAGESGIAGFRDGYGSDARFNQTAGIAQLPDGKVLISDMNNQCVRQLDRRTDIVTTYAGNCTAEPQQYSNEEYIEWETFNKPTTLQYTSYPTPKLFVLDVLEYGSEAAIVAKELDTANSTKIIKKSYRNINNFVHDPYSRTFAYADETHITNITEDGYVQKRYSVSKSVGLTAYDGVAIATNDEQGTITFVDQEEIYSGLFSICSSYRTEDLPSCYLTLPTAVAVVDGYLYVGATSFSSYYTTEIALKRIAISTNGTPMRTTMKTTASNIWNNWFTSNLETTTKKPYNWWDHNTIPPYQAPTYKPYEPVTSYNFDDDDTYYSDNDDDDYGLSGGTVALIVVAVIVGVGLKIALITFRVRRWNNRVILRRRLACRTTVVTVSSTSRVPYGRLRESPDPSGQFPTPPPYSAQTPAPPQGAALSGSANAPPAYSHLPPSVHNNPPSQPPPTTRY